MNQYKVHNIYVDICPECHGVWFDGGELGKITQEFELGNFAELFEKWKGELEKRERRVDFWEEGSYQCPKDYSVMKKHFYGGDSDIGMDNCSLCNGFWFDGGELQQIWEYNRPQPNKDILATGIIKMISGPDEIERRIRKKWANTALLLANPKGWALYALVFMMRTMINELLDVEPET